MAVTVQTTLRGFKSLQRALSAVPRQLRTTFGSGASVDVGFRVSDDARRACPRLHQALERSIDFKAEPGQTTIFVGVNTEAGDYAEIMHDGVYELGVFSQLKMEGMPVGRLYLDRAGQKNEAWIRERYQKDVDLVAGKFEIRGAA